MFAAAAARHRRLCRRSAFRSGALKLQEHYGFAIGESTIQRITLGHAETLHAQSVSEASLASQDFPETPGRHKQIVAQTAVFSLGRSGVKKADLQTLLDLYDVTSTQRAELTALAEESRKSGPIQAASMRLPEEHMRLLEIEADAESIWIWEPLIIPGLFQIEEYTHILLQEWVTRFSLPSGEVDRRVEARRLRQQILTRDPPVDLSAVIDESALNRRVGNASIMRKQLQHLAAISKLSNVDIRILPLDGEHFVMTGAFNYLSFRQIHDVPLSDTVVLDHLTGMDE